MTDPILIERYLRDANPIPHVDDLDPDEFARFVAVAHTRRAAPKQTLAQTLTRPAPTLKPPHHGRAWAFVLAIVLVLAGIGITALVLRDGRGTVTDEPAPPAVESFAWSRVPHDDEVFPEGSEMRSVTVGGPGLVAVGSDVWTSPDGITWSLIPRDPAVFGYSMMNSVTAGGPGLVAVGVGSLEELDYSVAHAMVWTSPDGINWSVVPYDPNVFGTYDGGFGTTMHAVTVGGPGLVAVGNGGIGEVPAVWTSPDGISWARVPHDPEVFGEGQSMGSVTAGGPGLVAVGADEFVGSGSAVWTSPDGFTWTRVRHDRSAFGGSGGQGMASVTAGGPGLVAVGGEEPDGVKDRAAVWTSTDGISWSRVAHDPEIFGEDGRGMRAVVAGELGLVAVGTDVWTSSDGITWSLVQQDVDSFDEARPGDVEILGGMQSVTFGGPGLVGVGTDAVGHYWYDEELEHTAWYSTQDAAVWVAEPES